MNKLIIDIQKTNCGKFYVFGALGRQWAARVADNFDEAAFKRYIFADIKAMI